jgi:hypothetical protein
MDDVHGTSGADPRHVRDWLNKDEGHFGYQNLTEEETAQAEEDGSSEEDEFDEKKEETCKKFKIFRSEINLGRHRQLCGL